MLTAFQDPFFFTLTCTALGLIVGSFLNVVILRLPRMMEQSWRRECCELLDQPPSDEPHLTLSYPGSQCPGCGTPIKPWQNIPVISWLALRGQCAQCGMRISARYPFVELVTGLLSGLAAWQFGFGPEALSALVLIWVLIALTGIDMDTQLLPDSMTLPLLWLGLGVNLFAVWTPISSAVMGAMLGYGSLWGKLERIERKSPKGESVIKS
jgi:leader peptidase (prepilin peptidase)/N-methyltransferase